MLSRALKGTLSNSHEPLGGFILQSLIPKSDAGCLTTATAYTRISLYVNGIPLFCGDSVHSANSEGITILAVVFTNNIEHRYLLVSSWLTEDLVYFFPI